MPKQITRDNHYVPQWYQKGFLPKGQHKLHVLNLRRTTMPSAHMPDAMEPEVEELGPKRAFKEVDLYTTFFGEAMNDDIETFLFGQIDKTGADAVRGWIAGDPIKIQRKFQDFFAYLDAQKLRTPKGLDWINAHFQGLPQLALMMQMQALRQMHCAMWSEGVREIVSAAKSPVKFLISDHPVTIYNAALGPDSSACRYPNDPGIELVGSQTLFAMDANHCLILTNLEYAEDPVNAALQSRRTNARFRDDTITKTDAFIRHRELTEAEVHAVNLVLKSRARKYVAAANVAWLFPEQYCTLAWDAIAKILLPQKDLWRFGGEIYIAYKDGTSAYRDQFGRTSKAHEYLAKPARLGDPAPDQSCGCGSGIAFRSCCAPIPVQLRPSWHVMGIRERNLALLRGITEILQLEDPQRSWTTVRRTLSDEQVRRIHELYAALWPADTRLIELLPSPQQDRSRALFLGALDARSLSSTITGMFPYVDELVLVHPFFNATSVLPSHSPLHHPELFRHQTLSSVLMLLVLEPGIRAGRIHLIPDPLEYDSGFREEIQRIVKEDDDIAIGPIDEARLKVQGREMQKAEITRLPLAEIQAYIRRLVPKTESMSEADIESVAELWKKEREEDPFALLDDNSSYHEEGEFHVFKGFARETGLFIATLTGSIVFTDSDTNWGRLLESDGVHRYTEDPDAAVAIQHLNARCIYRPSPRLELPPDSQESADTREILRRVTVSLHATPVDKVVEVPGVLREVQNPGDDCMFRLRAFAPHRGFLRTDVSRLVLTFGRLENVAPVRLALFLEPVTQSEIQVLQPKEKS